VSATTRRSTGPGLALGLGLVASPLVAYGVAALVAHGYQNCRGNLDYNASASVAIVLALGTVVQYLVGFVAVFVALNLDLPGRGLDTRQVTTAVMIGSILVVGFLFLVLNSAPADLTPAAGCPATG